jgi:hypothetical protein
MKRPGRNRRVPIDERASTDPLLLLVHQCWYTCTVALRFMKPTEIRSLDQLSDVEREQLRLAGLLYDGQDLPAAERLAEGDVDEGPTFLGFCELCRVVDGDEHVFDVWLYMVDSGTIFRAGTTEKVAEIIQFGLECPNPELRERLGTAMVEAQRSPQPDD